MSGTPGAPGARARVGIVLVSHSQRLAEGAVELAAQMAPGVLLVAAGGTDDGGLGTSYDRVEAAVGEALAAAEGVVVLADLGSAVMTVETVIELGTAPDGAGLTDTVRLADAPFVEGAVAAAVTAHGGGMVDEVLGSAEHAGGTFATLPEAETSEGTPVGAQAGGPPGEQGGVGSVRVALRNPLGLHARPAAVLARLIAGYDAAVTIDGVNGASVLELMKLGATGGQELTVDATGPQADAARAGVVEAIEGGFGEV